MKFKNVSREKKRLGRTFMNLTREKIINQQMGADKNGMTNWHHSGTLFSCQKHPKNPRDWERDDTLVL